MSYRDTIGWKKGIDLVVDIYLFTDTLPITEKYGLKSQLQRSATSIPSNVAEGYGRGTKADYARFVDIALGSTRELQTHLEVCQRIGLGDSSALINQAEEVARALLALRYGLRNPKSNRDT